MGLLGCAAIYMLLQFVVVSTIGTRSTDAPLTATASVLLGRGGAGFVVIAALFSIYGWISASMLYAPRLAYSLSAQGDFPAMFARLHPRFHTPTAAILFYAVTGWALASSGTFLWLVALTSGTMMILYAGVCASLMRLRHVAPESGRLQNSVRFRSWCGGCCNRACADDRTQAARTSFDVHYRANRQRKLAMGQMPSLGLGSENIDCVGSCTASLI
jgi:amino acid transporter